MPLNYPLLLQSVLHPRAWGEEHWLLSALPDRATPILNGPHRDRLLSEILPGFPLLFKIIHARQPLSLQVHPARGPAPKAELWHILEAAPDSRLILGLTPETTREIFSDALARGSLNPHLHTLSPAPGDTFHIPGGTPHAIGAGIRLYEAQQASDITYRLHDWGRPRPLQIEQALAALDLTHPQPANLPLPAATPHFTFTALTIRGDHPLPALPAYRILTLQSGALTLQWPRGNLLFSSGQTLLLPPAFSATLCAESPARLLLTVA